MYLLAILDGPDGIDLAEFCIAEGSLVLTDRGHLPIEQVRTGDRVLTHRGRWQRVTAVHDRGERDVVRVRGVGSDVRMTPEHRIWARKARQGLRSVEGHRDVFLLDPDWLPVQDAEFGATGRLRNTRYATPVEIEPLAVDEDLSWDSLDPSWLWLYGRWIADGAVSVHPQAGYTVAWSVGLRKAAEVERQLKELGLRYSRRDGNNVSDQVSCFQTHGRRVAEWLQRNGGRRAENKRLAPWVFGLTEAQRETVFDGLCSGDGHVDGNGQHYSTVSHMLACDIRQLAAGLGYSVSRTNVPGGRLAKFGTVTAQPGFVLTMNESGGRSTYVDDVQWSALTGVESDGRAHVWDLSVEGDHSFVVEGMVVHNCWVDEEQDDACFRAWDFQWSWFTCEDPLQIDQAGRSLGKSTGIQMRAFAFPFNHPGAEMLITAPELNHLRPLTDAVEARLLASRMATEMLPRGRGRGLARQPHWQVRFSNGARIMSRLPNKDGRGVKGQHPLVLESDEMQDYPLAGWIELIETLKRGSQGAQWRAHGVSRGVHDKFYEFTQEDSDFTVHRYMAVHRPSWTDEERREKVKTYGGSRQNSDYKRNIYGEHGDATNPVFVLARLMACVDIDEGSEYNTEIYQRIAIEEERVRGTSISAFLDLPGTHLTGHSLAPKGYSAYYGGADIGMCVDTETEIFTQRGWLRWNEVQVGDSSLAINPETGQSEWSVISDIFRQRKPKDGRDTWDMVRIEGQSFSALATPHHRWLTQREGGEWQWRQTQTLRRRDKIPLRAPRGDAPVVELHDDDLVELVGWLMTEGCQSGPYRHTTICQSQSAHPDLVKRIRGCLERRFGPSGRVNLGPQRVGGALWSEETRQIRHESRKRSDDEMVYFHLSAAIRDVFDHVMEHKVPTMTFLTALTQRQLDLLIDVVLLGDGWEQGGRDYIEQFDEISIRAFEAMCVLAGRAVTTCFDEQNGVWHSAIKVHGTVDPVAAAQSAQRTGLTEQSMSISEEVYDGVIWCPTLTHHNWLARRNGSVYFTGNTNHPTEMLVFGQRAGTGVMELLLRLHLERIDTEGHMEALDRLFTFYGSKLKGFGLDRTGLGFSIADMASKEWYGERFHGYNFSEHVAVSFREPKEGEDPNDLESLAEMRNVIEHSTDVLRNEWVDPRKTWLPFDRELLAEWQGQNYTLVKSAGSPYGKRDYARGKFHTLDAGKMAAAAKTLPSIQQMIEDSKGKSAPAALDIFVGAM